MMASNNRHSYVQFYPSDWIAGLAFMPPLAEWVYLQICLFNWDKREPLPAAEARIRLSRHAGWEDDLKLLIDAGKVIRTASGGLFVHRALLEAEKSFDLWARKSKGGKAGKRGKSQQDSSPENNTLNNTPGNTLGSNENENENESNSKELPRAGDLVFSVPADAWRDFKAHRIKIKAPMSKRAEELMLAKLERLWMAGHNPVKVMERSILKGWRDVFELKGDDNGNATGTDQRNGLLGACAE